METIGRPKSLKISQGFRIPGIEVAKDSLDVSCFENQVHRFDETEGPTGTLGTCGIIRWLQRHPRICDALVFCTKVCPCVGSYGN